MKISATIFVILISTCIVNASVLDPVIENVVHLKASKPPSGVAGIWKKKTIWKPRWVKDWKSAKVMKPVWKKVWSPVQIREWVPIPKPPPGWDSISTPLHPKHPKEAPVKDSAGHNSIAAHAATTIPLWDPIPYPESQQPPPPPPFPVHNPASTCDRGMCDNSHSGTFNHQQISEIINPQYGAPESFQNTEYSETVNHLTRLPPDGNNWRPPLPDPQTDNRFGSFPAVPEFLVPPMFRPLPDSNFRLQPNLNQQHFFNHIPTPFENGLRQWTPFPPETKIKGHFVTKPPDQPYKVQFPGMERHAKNRTEAIFSNNDSKEKVNFRTDNSDFRLSPDGDIVQEAHLVGEYHYSDFDIPKLKPESKKPQPSTEEKDQVKVKPQPKVKSVPDVQKHKTIHHPLGENKQKRNRTETQSSIHHPQNSQHVQKKHTTHSASNTSNTNSYQQQTTISKEIFPNYNPLATTNETLISQNHRFASSPSDNNKKHLPTNLPSTLPLAVEPKSGFNSSGTNVSSPHQKENHAAFEIRPNHRFSLPSNSVSKFNNLGTNSGTQRQQRYPVYELPNNHRFLPPVQMQLTASNANASHPNQKESYPVYEIPEISTPPHPPNHKLPLDAEFQNDSPSPIAGEKPERPVFERNGSVQLVFPTTDEVPFAANSKFSNHKLPAGGLQKLTTTTEPYSVIFSSSLLSTTEAVTRSPVVIVTPIAENKS